MDTNAMFYAMNTLHILATVVWVGGMFFAHMSLRPAANELLEPNSRLPLWLLVFQRFFFWVWVSIVSLLISGGLLLVLKGGFAQLPIHVHIMVGTGLFMVFLFCVLYFIHYPRFQRSVDKIAYEQAGRSLATIRLIMFSNLLLGLFTIVIAMAGPALLPLIQHP
jgi:uncharacterized membrane protein